MAPLRRSPTGRQVHHAFADPPPDKTGSGGGGGGTVTDITAGTGLTGTPNPIVGSGTIDLANTAVTPGTYGDATHVGQFTVDQQGRLTSASDVLITGVAPSAHDLLSASHGDTLAAAVSRGSLIVGNATPKWAEVTIGAANSFLGSDGTDAAWTAAGALTRVDDTNVTLTLGGTPATALLRAASLTLGWTGQLALTRGGTGINASSTTDLFNQLDPLTTRGDLLTRDATNSIRLAVGVANTFLKSDGTDPAWTAGAALTRVDDTNVTLTLGGSATSALVNAASLTLGWTGQLAIGRGGTGASTALGAFNALSPLTTRGDLLTRDATNNIRLAIGAANRFLGSDGTDASWTAPGALTKTDDTNVTLTLGGTPTTALLRAASLTLGWTGQLAIGRGGTGQSTATAAFDALAPTTTTGDLIYYNGADNVRLAVGGANTVLGVSAGAPAWQAQSYIDHGSLGGLTDDDHVGYTRLAGRTGTTNDTILSTSASGTLYGSSNASSDLNLQSTNTTRGLINAVDELRLRTGLTSSSAAGSIYYSRANMAVSATSVLSIFSVLAATGTFDDQGPNVINLFNNTATIKRSTANAAFGYSVMTALNNNPTYQSDGLAIAGGTCIGFSHAPTTSQINSGTLTLVVDQAMLCGLTVGTGTTVASRRGVYFQDATGAVTVTEQCALDVGTLSKGGSGIAVRSAIATATSGAVGTVASAPTAGGAGYTVGDTLTISTGGAGATVTVTAVSAGVVTAVLLTARGSGYTTGTGKATTGGTGAGCTLNITALQVNYFLRDTGGAQSSLAGKFTTYNNIATVQGGLTALYAEINATAQAAAITTGALYTPTAAGMFRVSFVITLTQAATTSSTVGSGVNLNYTTGDGATAVVQNVPMWIQGATTATTDTGSTANTVGTTLIGSVTVYASTAAMTYDVAYTSSGATPMQYAVRVRVEAL